MDQLTEQMNTVAAGAVAENLVRHHISTALIAATTNRAAHATRENPPESLPPRLIGLGAASTEPLTAWERNVLNTLRTHPQTEVISRKYNRRDGTVGFRYARAGNAGGKLHPLPPIHPSGSHADLAASHPADFASHHIHCNR